MELSAVERCLEGMQVFLLFDNEYLVFPLESMPVYGIIPEIDEHIDIKRNQRPLVLPEGNNATNEKGLPGRYIRKQLNLITNNFMRETSFGTNSISALLFSSLFFMKEDKI
jgi:hypothetical protein